MRLHPLVTAALLPLIAGAALAQAPTRADSTRLSVSRIFASTDFRAGSFGPLRWLDAGRSYTTLERPEGEGGGGGRGRGRDLVRYNTESGARDVLVAAPRLVPPGDSTPLDIEDYSWSPDGSRLLIFTNSERVWRANTRGDYWVLDCSTWKLTKLGGRGAASTLMFAKFAPDGRRVGWVRYGENNIYVEDVETGATTQLTKDGSRTVINGTFDWVYEEELGLQDGWRWSPDGRSIAYWQLDAAGVRDFSLINDTDSLYSFPVPVQYPKAGERNSAGRVGVVSASGGATLWLNVPGDPRENYIARMQWAPAAGAGAAPAELVLQHLNRLQNTLDILWADARSGAVRTVFSDRDSSWVDLGDTLQFVNGGKEFLLESERGGWNQLYLVSRDGKRARPLTPAGFDVITNYGVDGTSTYAYFSASPNNPTQRYLYRVRVDGKGKAERVSPAGMSGAHQYGMAPGLAYAVHTYSAFGVPPVRSLIKLPEHRALRVVTDNAPLKQRVAALERGPHEFTQLDVGNGLKLNAWIMKPPVMEPGKRYPVLMFVYGGPGSQTVNDSWGGNQYLWHVLLTQKGYIVASVDNRGTGARGRAFRKVVYGQLGVLETADQGAAARALGQLAFVDPARIGIWGWSYGGFMSLNSIFQHPDVFKTAIAVAPVTHWKFYDTIYTERYMGLPQQNGAGYDKGSPITYVRGLRGNLLVVHGSGDDNVHYQNTEVLVDSLVAAQRPFQLMVYPNRTHGIFGGGATEHLYALLTSYIEKNL
jgi:dipeptidyl-peptidase-4